MSDFTNFLTNAIDEASKLALSFYGNVTATVKSEDNNQVLTEADLAVGKLLVEKATERFPDFNLIDEETGQIDNKSEYTIVIDPIDGTSNFACGLPLYGIFMGILKGDVPVAGAIALPAFGDIYVAEKGKGAFRNGQPIHVSQAAELKNALVAYGIDGHRENPPQTRQETSLLGDIVLAIRNLRSWNSAFDLAAVADGRYGLFLNMTTKVWDNVAPQIIIEEAGGVFTDFYGKPMDYRDILNRPGENFTVCAGAPTLHRAMQSIVHANNT